MVFRGLNHHSFMQLRFVVAYVDAGNGNGRLMVSGIVAPLAESSSGTYNWRIASLHVVSIGGLFH